MEISSIHKTSTIAFGPTAGASQLLGVTSLFFFPVFCVSHVCLVRSVGVSVGDIGRDV